MMNSMAKKLLAILAAVLLVTGLAYGMSINGQLVKAMFENLSSDPTGYLGRVYYNTTSNTVKIYNGSSWVEIGSSSSGGAASNLIENGNAETASVPTSWTTFDDGAVAVPVDGTGGSPSAITAIARTTTAGELIDQTASFKLVKSAANAQGEGWAYDFSLKTKSQLFSQLVTLNFDYYMSSASADSLVVYLYDRDNATLITPRFTSCGGGSTPALTAQTTSCHAQIAWLSTTADDYRLIFMVSTTGTSAHNYFFDNIYTGQFTSAVGAAVGDWVTYTPTGTWSTNTAYSGRKRRVGDSMEYQVSVQLSGAPDAVALKINQPSGETIDSSKIADTSRGRVGNVTFFDATGADTGRLIGEIVYGNTTASDVYVIDDASGSAHYMQTVTATIPVTFANGDRVVIDYKVPIANFAGTSSYGENSVEYAFNTGTWDATDTTNFGYGAAGSAIGGTLTAARAKTVRFSAPVDATDNIVLQFQTSTTGPWVNHAQFGVPYLTQNTTTYGVFLTSGTIGSTDVIVNFQQYATATGATFSAAGSNWNSSWRWRVVKHKAGIPVGFGIADAVTAGMVSTTAQTFAGLKTFSSEVTAKINHTDLGSTASTDVTNSQIRSGLFTWGGSGVTNVAALSSSSRPMMWSLNGKVVSAAGSVSLQCTSGADADTQFTMTLPITPTSNFATQEELMGTGMFIATHPSANNRPVAIYATASAKTATFRFTCSSASAGRELIYNFLYRIN